MAVLLKTTLVRVSFIQIMQIRVQNKGKSVWKSRYVGYVSDAHTGSHIFYEDLYRSNRITTYVVPFVIGMLLARDSIVGISIPSSISLPEVSLLVP